MHYPPLLQDEFLCSRWDLVHLLVHPLPSYVSKAKKRRERGGKERGKRGGKERGKRGGKERGKRGGKERGERRGKRGGKEGERKRALLLKTIFRGKTT